MINKKRRPLGHVNDRPREILALAATQAGDAENHLAVREAAEMAYLALASSLEVLAGETIESESGQRAVTGRLERHSRGLAKTFFKLKRELHGRCFHQADCTKATALIAIGKVDAFLERLPKRLP